MGEEGEWCHAVGERTEWGAVGRQGTRPAEVSGGSAALLHAVRGVRLLGRPGEKENGSGRRGIVIFFIYSNNF
jgi:hypothetical protein